MPCCPTSGASMSRRWPPTTDSSPSGRSMVRRISSTAPRWSARRWPASTAASVRPWTFTSRPSARPAPMALSTTRRLPTNWPRASTPRAASSRSRSSICATPGTATCGGVPTARYGNSMRSTRTSGRQRRCPARRARSGHRSNTWTSRLCSKSRKPCPARSSSRNCSTRSCARRSSTPVLSGGCCSCRAATSCASRRKPRPAATPSSCV